MSPLMANDPLSGVAVVTSSFGSTSPEGGSAAAAAMETWYPISPGGLPSAVALRVMPRR